MIKSNIKKCSELCWCYLNYKPSLKYYYKKCYLRTKENVKFTHVEEYIYVIILKEIYY
jgi:hypothetical protein